MSKRAGYPTPYPEVNALMDELLAGAREVLGSCERVLVSLGREGAVLVTAEGAWHARARGRVKVVHTVGCGDALFAGFLCAYARGASEAEAVRFAVACGTACVGNLEACVRSRAQARKALGRVVVRCV